MEMEELLKKYGDILTIYYENDAKKLQKLVNKVFYEKFDGIVNKDMDDFYSVANDVFTDIVKKDRYDSSKGDFAGFLYKALYLAFIDEFKHQTRDKRITKIEIEEKNEKGELIKKKIPIKDVYLDAPSEDSENSTLRDTIPSKLNVEKYFFESNKEGFSKEMQLYLNRLSPLQQEVLRLISIGFIPSEIIEELHISKKLYEDCCEAIHSYRNTSILL